MAALRAMPHPAVALTDPTSGRMTPEWFQYFSSRERAGIANLTDVSTTAPTNGQVLIWNDTTKLWVPGSN